MNLFYQNYTYKFFKNFIKIILLFTVLFFWKFTSYADTGSWDLFFSWTTFFSDINYDSFKNEIEKEVLSIDYNGIIWDFETINYSQDLSDIKNILFQIFLVNMIVWFFVLFWVFYSITNDLLWKK